VSPHAFISYSHSNDSAYVDALAAFLASQGITGWYDKGMVSGDRWDEVIRDQIDGCAAFIVVMTPDSEASTWVMREITEAEKQQKPILPLLLAGRNFFRLGHLQFEDVSQGQLPSKAFVERVRARLEGRPDPYPDAAAAVRAPLQRKKSRRAVLVTGIASLAALGGGGALVKYLVDQPITPTPEGEGNPAVIPGPPTTTTTTTVVDTPPTSTTTTPPTTKPVIHSYAFRVAHTEHSDPVLSVSFSPDGIFLASGGLDSLRVWRRDVSMFGVQAGGVWSVAYSKDGRLLATGSNDSQARIWFGDRQGVYKTITTTEAVVAVALSPDGAFLATGSLPGVIKVWRVETGALEHTIVGSGGLRQLTYSPDGTQIAEATYGSTTTIYRASDGTLVRKLSHGGGDYSVAFSNDGQRLVTGGADGILRLWRADTGDLLVTSKPEHGTNVLAVAFSPDDALIGTGGKDQTVRLFKGDDTQQLQVFTGHTAQVQSVAFSGDGLNFASGSDDKTVRVFGRQ
jgi:WD40 repeat protein